MEKYIVTGMSCAACSARVEKAVSALPGVESCSVSLLTGSMNVEGSAVPDAVIKAVCDAGYGASIAEITLEDRETPRLKKRLLSSLGFLVLLMYISMGSMFGWPLPEFMKETIVSGAVQAILSAVVMIVNRKFYINGFKGVLHRAANMDTLVALGSGASFVYSMWILISGAGSAYYFDSAAMILVLITVGKLLEARSKGKTTDALKELIEMTPQKAILVRDGIEVTVSCDDVKVGDIFVVYPGGKVPVDGTVSEGTAFLDESSLTGESVLAEKLSGTEVFAGSIVVSGKVTCEAKKVGADTAFSKIVKMVSDASATKAPIARLADRVSGIFVPSVIGIAIITLIIWMLTGRQFGFALARAISVLVISCPCALGLATPVAIMVGSGLAAKNGILFKNAVSLERIGKTEIAAFDKTGTLTKGNLKEKDSLKDEGKKAVEELKRMGIHPVMITGDKKSIAEKIAAEAAIDDIISEVLPDGKGIAVKKLKKSGLVSMIGDGINDAPALTEAEVGIAIGAGTDVAIDSADVVITKSSLLDVAAAVRIGRATLRNIHQNLFWAFCYNVICIPIAAGVLIPICGFELNPMIGAAAMSLSSFCVVTNSLRLNLTDPYNSSKDKKIHEVIVDIDSIINSEEETTMEKYLNIEGMMCPHCEARVKNALEALPQVSEALVSHENNNATVKLSEDVSDDVLKKAVEDAGYVVK